MWNFRRKIKIKQWKKQIEDAGTLDKQLREADGLRPVVDDWRGQLEQRATALSARAQEESERRLGQAARSGEPFAIQSEHYVAIVLLLGAWVTMILDIFLSAILATSWINLPWLWALVVGAVVAVILSLMCKAGILAVAYDAEKPRPTRRRLQWIALVSFIASFTCIALILAARNPSESWIEYFMALTGFSLGALGVLMPILAGALMALAHDLNWSYHYEQEYRQVKQSIAEIAGFIEWMGHLQQHLPRTYPLFVVALSLALSSVAQAQVLEIWVDDSRSISQAVREKGVGNLQQQIPSLIGKHGIQQIRVLHFSHDPWTAQAADFKLPQQASAPCAAATAAGEKQIFKQFDQHRRKLAEAKCAEQRARERQDYQAQLAAVLASVSQSLLALQQADGPCTAVYDLLGRLATGHQPKRVIIITDAAETCRKSVRRLAPPSAGVSVMMLLVPGKGGGFDGFTQRKICLAQFVPWVKVEPLFSEQLSEVF
jgi:hypothetical protein